MPTDIRDEIFRSIEGQDVVATVEACDHGIVCGLEAAIVRAAELELGCDFALSDGDSVRDGESILTVRGPAREITMAEESLIGLLAKPSGVATATRRLVQAAGRIRIVGGAWKKIPLEIRSQIRHAIAVGGAHGRMAEHPMIYMDKNYVRMLGGVRPALEAIAHLPAHNKVIQLPGEDRPVAEEARIASELGATTVFVDTGNPADVKPVVEILERLGRRDRIRVAFAGGVTLESLAYLETLGVDALCIGRSIVDAPLLDMRLVVREVAPRPDDHPPRRRP
jgi:nicotinate-nucleotide pyrophosphorylase (carboxylating)